MTPSKYSDLLQTVQLCQHLLLKVQEELQDLPQPETVDYKKKYETLLGERVHLLNELGQLLLERERANRPALFLPAQERGGNEQQVIHGSRHDHFMRSGQRVLDDKNSGIHHGNTVHVDIKFFDD